jgi:DNA polymerase-3 subunit gamma/tau
MALYNKYRPTDFSMVCGQPHIKRILQSQVKKNDLVHAYLFTGKTTVARILACMINATGGMTDSPKIDDPHVVQIMSGKAGIDVYEMDAASNRGVDDIKEVREKAYYVPIEMKKRVYIIDECHMLTKEAWNALLKVLEEPPQHAIFILCTTDHQKVIQTVKTRCMCLPFRSLQVEEVVQYFKPICAAEKITITDDALRQLIVASKGSMRDAFSKLEIIKHNDGMITERVISEQLGIPGRSYAVSFINAVAFGGFVDALAASSPSISAGTKPEDFYAILAEVMHDLLILKAKDYDIHVRGYSDAEIEELAKLQENLSTSIGPNLYRLIGQWINTIQDCVNLTVFNVQPQFQVDVLFVKMRLEFKHYQQLNKTKETKN